MNGRNKYWREARWDKNQPARLAHQAGHSTGHGRLHFAVQHAGVLVPRLAQAHGQIDQARQHPAAAGIHGLCGGEIGRGRAHGKDFAVGNRHIPHLVQARGRVDDAAIANQYVHCFHHLMALTLTSKALIAIVFYVFTLHSRPRWTSPPCARRCQTSLARG